MQRAAERDNAEAQSSQRNAEQGKPAVQRQDGGVNPPLQSVPRLIKYSGTLKDSKGAPKSGVAGVTFAIYAEQEGGAPVWMETQNVTFDEGGRYTVLLGANSSEGVPVELFTTQWRVASGEWREKDNAETQSSPRSAEQAGQEAEGTMYRAPTNSARVAGQERWLGVEGPDIQETPRVLLVSVPYALKAADAETLGGMPASAFVLASPQTGSTSGATTSKEPGLSPATTLNATSNPLKPKAASSSAQTTAATTSTANLLAKYDSTSNLVPSAIFESNGNVGIGTTNPLAPFHVNGNTLLVQSGTTAQTQVSGAASSGRFGQDSNGTFLASDTKGSSLRFLTSNGSLNEWMRIGSNGNVSIGSAQFAQFGEAVFAGTIWTRCIR